MEDRHHHQEATQCSIHTRTTGPDPATDALFSLAGLFAIAFVAATILPAQWEAALVGLLVLGKQSPVLLIVVATIGNVLGSAVNWALGRWIERYRRRRWFPVSEKALDRASGWYHRWGRWSLLFSWAPLVGDALTMAAGVLREPIWSFLILVTIAKVDRYILLSVIALGVP